MAISVSGGCSASDAAKATSSAAAPRAVSRSGAPKCSTRRAAKVSIAAPRVSSSASTTCTSVDQPRLEIPKKPLRNAVRALPSSVAGSASRNANAPGTAHSPGSAARSNTKVSDGSSRMVRNSFMRAGLRCADRARTAPRARGRAGACRSRVRRRGAPKDRRPDRSSVRRRGFFLCRPPALVIAARAGIKAPLNLNQAASDSL